MHISLISPCISGSVHDGLSSWLRMHEPRKISHDADLLRRRILAEYTEQPPAALAAHGKRPATERGTVYEGPRARRALA